MTAPEPTRPADEHTGTVALDLDAIEAAALADDGWWSVPVLALVAEVRRLTVEAATQREWFEAADAAADRRLDQSIAWMERAEAAEAEVVTLRAKVTAVQALAEKRDVLYPPKWAFGAEENYCNGYRQARADFIAAMATGEGK